jgi:hypothetical protein
VYYLLNTWDADELGSDVIHRLFMSAPAQETLRAASGGYTQQGQALVTRSGGNVRKVNVANMYAGSKISRVDSTYIKHTRIPSQHPNSTLLSTLKRLSFLSSLLQSSCRPLLLFLTGV